MARGWDAYSRQGLDIASTATSIGFSVAKSGTRLGFSIARNVATTVVGLTTSFVDSTLFGGSTVTTPLLGSTVSAVFTLAEQITLAPIHLSEYITATSLLAAHSSINVLSVIFPGSSDASFSLASFITLVKREWPARQYGITQVARAIVAWVALQGVTQEWQEESWFKYLQEIDVNDAPTASKARFRRDSRVRVTSDVIYPGAVNAQIISADIGKAPTHKRGIDSDTKAKNQDPGTRRTTERRTQQVAAQLALTPQEHDYNQDTRSRTKSQPLIASLPFPEPAQPRVSIAELKSTLRRLSKIVLAGYGGASLLFFGISPDALNLASSPTASALAKTAAEVQLTHAIDASEAEAAGEEIMPNDVVDVNDGSSAANGKDNKRVSSYAWWDILLGKHDKEILERSIGVQDEDHHGRAEGKGNERDNIRAEMQERMEATAVVGSEHLIPRFWVLTDYNRGQVVLVLRGTMSLNEIAVDLTCEPEPFKPATSYVSQDAPPAVPGNYQSPETGPPPEAVDTPTYHVHSGMLRLARAMGDVGKPVQLAVQDALHHNPGFELVMCGHSLGAGVATLLGLMWADPRTCLTVPSSGLPVGRRVYVYCFAPPCITDASLSKLANRLVVSFAYSHDVVTRLSLGSVRDLRNAAMWLCEAEATNNGGDGEGWSAITRRARAWKSTGGNRQDMDWFIATRKTLEANMQNVNMFPPGRVFWAVRENDLHPSHNNSLRHYRNDGATIGPSTSDRKPNKLRLFEVSDVEKVFSQIVFAKDMLTAHMPHQYDRVLHDLL
ncbi:hypothetical protein F5887DRAFT_1125059 [Amanita rubescens]|nr:hypothetical protein F5887DRAFT_1125059 [Amanita rubescens]